MPATPVQKALFVSAPGEPFVLGELPIPAPGPHDVLVKIESAALNPVDWKVHDYGFAVTDYHAILGSDAADAVQEVGEGVTGFAVGDRMYVYLPN